MSDLKSKDRPKNKVYNAIEEGALLAIKASVFTVLFGGAIYGLYKVRQWNHKPRTYIDPKKLYCEKTDPSTNIIYDP